MYHLFQYIGSTLQYGGVHYHHKSLSVLSFQDQFPGVTKEHYTKKAIDVLLNEFTLSMYIINLTITIC